MPVGTQASIKGAFIDDIIKTGTQIISEGDIDNKKVYESYLKK